MQRHPPQLGNARIGRVMIQITGTPPPHVYVRVGETPEHGCEARLSCARSKVLIALTTLLQNKILYAILLSSIMLCKVMKE